MLNINFINSVTMEKILDSETYTTYEDISDLKINYETNSKTYQIFSIKMQTKLKFLKIV